MGTKFTAIARRRARICAKTIGPHETIARVGYTITLFKAYQATIHRIIRTHDTMSSAIFTANLPTLVPPNFCTSHFAAGSMEFWCRFGGVGGGVIDETDEPEERYGEDGGEGVGEACMVSLLVLLLGER